MAMLLTLAVAALAAYLLFVGQRWESVSGVRPGQPLGPARVEYRPYPLAIIHLAAAALMLIGLWSRRQRALAWAGLLFLVLFGGLTVFGPGVVFLLAAGLLLLLLAVIWLLQRGGS